ncbi:extracellular solute-binding protein [Actinopolymorpha pittospori]|uniref:Aldouronate transport system substrate-binding protein n=1 Tax=Actinopolymorpha pittospori TaxID=648752 RepID=A0A927MZX6_9ACTN|nr:extracellular solute-binding protein [Actinopolymorpha pittospori]MBE1609686.1 putative aldouronate transport system substrate-binding protein [Actinopolymorpha pittospori]
MEGLSRRRLLAAVGMGAAGAALGGCAGGAAEGGFRRSHPLRLPFEAPQPNVEGAIPSGTDGVPTAYRSFVSPPYRSVASPPGSGGTVTTFQILYGPPPPPVDENPWWQELNKRLNVQIKPILVPDASLGDKLQTMIASGNPPDLTYVHLGVAPAAMRVIRQGAFTDLTPYIGGDAVKEFPNLARLPTYMWRNSAIEGGLYGVPRVIPIVNGTIGLYRRDWARKLGYPEPPKNAEELLELFTAFSKGDPDGNSKVQTWGLGNIDTNLVRQMFRVPNGWRRESNGRLVNAIETDEFEESLKYLVRMWKAGVFHPDAPNLEFSRVQDLYMAGRTGLFGGGYIPLFGRTGTRGSLRKTFPTADPYPLLPPGHDGGDPQMLQGPGYFGFMSIPSKVGADEKRAKELLRILDYYAAPFGSEEYVFMTYGIEGKQFNYDDDGSPVAIDDDRVANWDTLSYMCQTMENAFYYPGAPEDAVLAQQTLKRAVELSVADPTLGLVSNLAISRNAALSSYNDDRQTGIVTGREPLSVLAEWRRGWRERGGDKIREEYQEALARAQG